MDITRMVKGKLLRVKDIIRPIFDRRRKRMVIRYYQKLSGARIFIETGTYRGDTLASVMPFFDALYSIELSDELFAKASERFEGAEKIRLLHGDSGEMISTLAGKSRERCLYWLDAHYSGTGTARGASDTPIGKEIEAILMAENDGTVILVDDARLFNGDSGYPTIGQLESLVKRSRPKASMEVSKDIIRIRI